MHFGNIDFPRALVKSARKKKLVIFAGAGVSMQAPTSYASFDGLVEQIANGIGRGRTLRKREANDAKKGYTESAEHYLGYLQGIGDVHVPCAAAFNDHRPPSDLHRQMLSLFGPTDQIRIVTTNFDHCFEDALKEQEQIPTSYCAPALPLGGDFNGIVHLHGRADQPSSQILTDMDFGHAYITNGWAASFLVPMFENYTVLFVGYSCKDTMMEYVTRSLSADNAGNAYSLVRIADDDGEWSARGITPIHFEDFSDLAAAFDSWASASNQTLSERIDTLRRATSNLTSESVDSQEILRELFANQDDPDTPTLIREGFCKAATTPESLAWFIKQGHLACTANPRPSEIDRCLYDWLARGHAFERADVLITALAKSHGKLNGEFGQDILSRLASDYPGDRTAAKWLEAMFGSLGLSWSEVQCFPLLNILEHVESANLALYIFRLLLTVRPTPISKFLSHDIVFSSDFIVGSASFYDTVLEEIQHWAAKCGQQLWWLCIRQIEACYCHQALMQSDSNHDLLSFMRSAIEPHEQDKSNNQAIDLLIDAARTLGGILVSEGRGSELHVDSLLTSNDTIIKRIGMWLYGTMDQQPRYVLSRIISEGWLTDIKLNYETYHLVSKYYPSADPQARYQFLDAAMESIGMSSLRYQERAKFELLSWLSDACPEDAGIAQKLDPIVAEHPGWKPSSHPDLTHYVEGGAVTAPEEAIVPEDAFIASHAIKTLADTTWYANGARSEDVLREEARRYPRQVPTVLRDLLRIEDVHAIDAITIIASQANWAESCQSEKDQIIQLVTDLFSREETLKQAAWALREIVDSTKAYASLTLNDKARLYELVISNWDSLVNAPSGFDTQTHADWVNAAINWPCGWTLRAVTKIICQNSLAQNGQELQNAINTALAAKNGASKMIAALLCSDLTTWMRAYPEFSRTTIVPLIDNDALQVPSLQGLAMLSGITKDAWLAIYDKLNDAYAMESQVDPQTLGGLCPIYILGSLYYGDSEQKTNAVGQCLQRLDCVRQAMGVISRYLESMTSDKQRAASWDTWLSPTLGVALGRNDQTSDEVASCLARWVSHAKPLAALKCRILQLMTGCLQSTRAKILPSGEFLAQIASCDDLPVDDAAKLAGIVIEDKNSYLNREEAIPALKAIFNKQPSPGAGNALQDSCLRAGISIN